MKGVLIGCLVSVLCYLSRRAIYALPRIKGQVIGGIALCKRTQRNRRSPCRVASLSAQVVRTTANTAAGPGR